MPIMGGVDATQEIRKLGEAVHQPYIVAFTGTVHLSYSLASSRWPNSISSRLPPLLLVTVYFFVWHKQQMPSKTTCNVASIVAWTKF